MKPSVSLDLQPHAVGAAAKRYQTTNARVFGSVLRGDDAQGSDLDLLVDPLPGATLFDLGGLQFELKTLLGVPVDVLTPGDLPLKFRAQALSEARPV
ncbi:nucleotidyltransferase family protein [Rhodoferax antarcticus]|uniref:Putative nucleotidyltransferase domain protein n=1 Tax=Rhodoferax antarcticus ANT.BR TaxID=1111071 RepID=A0A1Q8YET8_9BURK|nr:nucleotidyltransferase family protein [Rhodoferax antarcticus]APW46320.1 nucleotidyltransferase [Rhodoferax antarcticus]OLP06536.1 putative nucleotidyltransferase domain protein [Rhodoferax antarcticus ANT.BR]